MIEFTAILEYLLPILGTILTAAGAYVITKVGGYLNIKKDGELNKQLDAIAKRAVNFALERLYARGSKYTIKTENELIENAANYLIESAPKILAYFGFTKERVKAFIEARLNGVEFDEEDEGHA